MSGYFLRRLSLSLLTLTAIAALTFALLRALPGDPVDARLAGETRLDIDAAAAAHLRRQFGLERPPLIQAADWIGRCFRFDFGASFADDTPVAAKIGRALTATALLNGAAVAWIVLFSLAGGMLLAANERRAIDIWAGRALALLLALPASWGALLLQRALAVELGWFPLLGASAPGSSSASAAYLVLPLLAATYRGTALYTRLVRQALLKTRASEYVQAARARGVTPHWIHVRYTLRNAALPLISLIPTLAPAMVAGGVVVETVFGWPGVGRLLVDGVLSRDFPVVLAIAWVGALFVHACALVTEFLMLFSDPRLRAAETP